jgi:hypothetical protein
LEYISPRLAWPLHELPPPFQELLIELGEARRLAELGDAP